MQRSFNNIHDHGGAPRRTTRGMKNPLHSSEPAGLDNQEQYHRPVSADNTNKPRVGRPEGMPSLPFSRLERRSSAPTYNSSGNGARVHPTTAGHQPHPPPRRPDAAVMNRKGSTGSNNNSTIFVDERDRKSYNSSVRAMNHLSGEVYFISSFCPIFAFRHSC